MEIREVPGYPGLWAAEDGRLFRPYGHDAGDRRYAKVTSYGRTVAVHRAVCLAFHGEPPTPEHQAAHRDGNTHNNEAANLYWATPAENHDDKRRHGTWGRRFTEDEIRRMKARLAEGARGVDVAREFNTTTGFVSMVRNGQRWAHV